MYFIIYKIPFEKQEDRRKHVSTFSLCLWVSLQTQQLPCIRIFSTYGNYQQILTSVTRWFIAFVPILNFLSTFPRGYQHACFRHITITVGYFQRYSHKNQSLLERSNKLILPMGCIEPNSNKFTEVNQLLLKLFYNYGLYPFLL